MKRVIVVLFVFALGFGLLSLACGKATPTASKATVVSTSVPATTVPTVGATEAAKAVATTVREPTAVPVAAATVATPTAPSSATPGAVTAPGTVTANANANLRGGPGTNFLVVGSVRANAPLQVVGRNSAGDWYLLSTGAWIAARLVNGKPDVPVAEAIPTPGTATQPTTAPQPTAAPSPVAQQQVASFGDGMKMVGTDVAPGTYRSPGGSGCYWERLKGLGGTFEEILANDNATGPTLVAIAKTDKAFNSKRCNGWTSDLSAITSSPTAPFGDGTFLVNTDIAPGTWRSPGGSGCYWARFSGFGGTLDELLANENASGPTLVTIAKTDKGFNSKRCNEWTQDLAPITSSPTAPFGDGTFLVNKDVAPGSWRSSGTENCYWARLGGFSGELRDIIANGNVSEPTVVTISPGDAGFSSVRCGTWTQVQ